METFDDIIIAMQDAVDSVLTEAFGDGGSYTNGWQRLDAPGCKVRIPPRLLTGDDFVQFDINGNPITWGSSAIAEFAVSITDTLLYEMTSRNLRIIDSKKMSMKYVSLWYQYGDKKPEKALSDDVIKKYSECPWLLTIEIGIPPMDVEAYGKLSAIWMRHGGTFKDTSFSGVGEIWFKALENKAKTIKELLGWDPLSGDKGTISFEPITRIINEVIKNVAYGMLENEEIMEKIEVLKPILERLAEHGEVAKVRPFAEGPILRTKDAKSEKEIAIKALKDALSDKFKDNPYNRPNLKFYIKIPAAPE